MEKLTLYAYIQQRIAGRRTDSIVQDLIDDMRRDKELAGMIGSEIVHHIRWRACEGARLALSRFLQSYKHHCKAHNYEPERL